MRLARNTVGRGPELRWLARESGVELDCYDEYVRGLDEVPTLHDAVSPGPKPPPDFRSGERPDQRKEPRPDAWLARESLASEIERLYREYSSDPPPAAKKTTKRTRGKTGKRRRKKKR
jgi:hypothetical protein